MVKRFTKRFYLEVSDCLSCFRVGMREDQRKRVLFSKVLR